MGIQILPAVGAANGVNVSFSTPTPYKPTTLRVALNGQLLQIDCAQEDDPSLGTWTWLDPQPPRTGDSVYVIYDEAGGEPDIIPVHPLVGTVRPVSVILGVVALPPRVVGVVDAVPRVVGVVRQA